MGRGLRRIRLVAVAAVAGLALAACGGGNINNSTASGSKAKCGNLRIAVNPWVGYVSNAHVIGYLAKTKFGCNVTYPAVKEEVGWQGMSSGSIDTIVENWGHPDLVKKYIDQQKKVANAGLTGGNGIIGWYVPPWMAKKYPDITSWKNLNKYAGLFKTSESGGKGQLLDGDPSYVTNDEALVKNLKLNYKVVVGGSEAALIQSFRSAEKNKTPLLAYFYQPQ
ncbi:MAG: glycine/betaine ABC transporter substrate-binding protein, partial [Actinomycetota bacterium]|nr:glycine/betaine ABC transporter substrate-binding protein [Actinomycetota bacterium]